MGVFPLETALGPEEETPEIEGGVELDAFLAGLADEDCVGRGGKG